MMDRKEAADLLDNLIGMVEDNHGEDYDTALKMGIEALSANGDTIYRQAAIDMIEKYFDGLPIAVHHDMLAMIHRLPSAQPETAKRIVGKSRDGMTLWYQCDMCNEPVDAQDDYCRGCGRRLIDG